MTRFIIYNFIIIILFLCLIIILAPNGVLLLLRKIYSYFPYRMKVVISWLIPWFFFILLFWKFMGLDTPLQILADFSKGVDLFIEWLNSLSFTELCLIFNTTASIGILTLSLNLIKILFGNFLVKYFELEKRFPWLSITLKWRRNFNNLGLVWNIFLIIILGFFLIYVNITTFLYI